MTRESFPERIVCLTEETVETLYLLGEQDRIVGVSGFARRPPEVRTKPRVATFLDAKYDDILALKPDLVLTFSDVQAEIIKQLALRGVTVFHFNQRRIAGIFEMIVMLTRLIGREADGAALIAKLESGLDKIRDSAKRFPHRPRVYFEEWDDPLIGGIGWVEELIEIAGGEPVFPALVGCGKAQDRVVTAADVIARDPEVILASWCGKKVKIDEIASRPGWDAISAVRNRHVYEIPSDCILQPGPASLTDGVKHLHAAIARAVGVEVAQELLPAGMGGSEFGTATADDAEVHLLEE
ncbi:MAG: cobalamin-binding protein [Acidobacteriota bacterium]|nr:cobalamin-binding protein [Acidobacteriota bacterium]